MVDLTREDDPELPDHSPAGVTGRLQPPTEDLDMDAERDPAPALPPEADFDVPGDMSRFGFDLGDVEILELGRGGLDAVRPVCRLTRSGRCQEPTEVIERVYRKNRLGKPEVAMWSACVRGFHPAQVESWECDGSDICEIRDCPVHNDGADAPGRRGVMPTAAEKNAAEKAARGKRAQPKEGITSKKPSLTDLPEPDLRAKLLATPTLPDQAWAPKLGKPDREKGESRSAYIARVLAAK